MHSPVFVVSINSCATILLSVATTDQFDMKFNLIKGIQMKLSDLSILQPVCADYRTPFLSQLQGVFKAQDVSSREFFSISIDNNGIFNLPNGAMTFVSPNDGFGIHHNLTRISSDPSDDIHFDGNDHAVIGKWDFSGQFSNIQTRTTIYAKADNVLSSGLAGPIDLIGSATNIMRDYRGVFPPNTCKTYSDPKNPTTYTTNDKYIPIAVTGKTLTVGEKSYELKTNLVTENMAVMAVNKRLPLNDYESQFDIAAGFSDGTNILFRYKQFKGIVLFQVTPPSKIGWSCFADWY